MDHSLISAVAALAGAAIIAAGSFIRSWLIHQGKFERSGSPRRFCAAKTSTTNLSRRPQSATFMQSNTTNPTFPYWWSYTQK